MSWRAREGAARVDDSCYVNTRREIGPVIDGSLSQVRGRDGVKEGTSAVDK